MNKVMKNAIMLIGCALATTGRADTELKVRGGAFIPTASRFRDIYGNVAGNVQLEVATHLYKCLDFWANVDWYGRKGHSTPLCFSTNVNVINGSFGVKVPWDMCDALTLYAGVGPSFGGILLKNFAPYGCQKISKPAFGVVIKSGSTYCLTECTFLDLYVDYLYQRPIDFECKVNIGGFKIGAGLGWKF